MSKIYNKLNKSTKPFTVSCQYHSTVGQFDSEPRQETNFTMALTCRDILSDKFSTLDSDLYDYISGALLVLVSPIIPVIALLQFLFHLVNRQLVTLTLLKFYRNILYSIHYWFSYVK